MKNIDLLKGCFNNAIKFKKRYVGIVIKMDGFEKPELIINITDNFQEKLEYYKRAYNEDLTLKSFNGIKIVDFVASDCISVIESTYQLYTK